MTRDACLIRCIKADLRDIRRALEQARRDLQKPNQHP